MGIVFWVVAIAAVVYLISTYNGLVEVKNAVSKAWANIDVMLKQRHDELPKLIDTCKHYMHYEQTTLEKVMAARAQVASARQEQDVAAVGLAESGLRSGLGQLFALAENYPELQANAQFVQLQSRISALESSIADRREFYNESVTIYNVRIAQFPDVLLAKLLHLAPLTWLQFGRKELQDVDIAARFNA